MTGHLPTLLSSVFVPVVLSDHFCVRQRSDLKVFNYYPDRATPLDLHQANWF